MGECIDGIFQCECGAQQFATEIYVTIANHRTWINIVPLFTLATELIIELPWRFEYLLPLNGKTLRRFSQVERTLL